MSAYKKKPFHVPGPSQLAVIQAAVGAGRFEEVAAKDRVAARKANGFGYLERDKKQASVWYPTDKAREMLTWLEGQIAGGETLPAQISSAPNSGIAAMDARLSHARGLLADGDVMAARQLAEGVYDQAQAGGRFSARFHLKESLAACRQIQADALSIEVRTKMRIAEEWERAKEQGKTLKGRPKSVPDENAFTAEEAGLTRKDLHYAKKLLDADRRKPGIAERAIAARLAAGLEPTRASLRVSIGTKTGTKEERGNNLYETPDVAVHALLAHEDFRPLIWEPACGKGAICRVLEAYGFDLSISDLVDYGLATEHGEYQGVEDFLQTRPREWPDGEVDIITNPPYGEHLNAFVAHALRVHRPRKMALLLNVIFIAGTDDENRIFAREVAPPARVHVMTRRLPMMHRDGWAGEKATSSMITAWFVWELQEDGTYGAKGDTRMNFVDWKDHAPADVKSEAA